MTNNEIIALVNEHLSSKIKFAVTDIDGILRGKIISKEKFLEIAESDLGFCDVIFGWDANDKCYDNIELTGWHTGYPDANARIDLSTYREIPWNNQLPFFIADFSFTGRSGMGLACPRTLLKGVKKKANEMGFSPVFSEEFEWFNFVGKPGELAADQFANLEPLSPGMFGYSVLRPTLYQDYFNNLFDLLEQFNIGLEGLHTETGPGVYEGAIRYDEVVNAADKAVLFKNSVKEIAYQHGIVASFMAKWNEQLPGCSGHLHQSLWDLSRGSNLFYTGDDREPMSDLMKHYLAGVLYCMPEIMPMYAPTINSYKRLREGAWAPTTVSWGFDNRTVAARIIVGSEKSTRLEMRLPGADSNPYLAMAASLASGLYGIENKLELNISATVGNAYADKSLEMLPENLGEATRRMKDSELASTLFGEGFVKHFCATREWEWRAYAGAVTSWELKRYFEII